MKSKCLKPCGSEKEKKQYLTISIESENIILCKSRQGTLYRMFLITMTLYFLWLWLWLNSILIILPQAEKNVFTFFQTL